MRRCASCALKTARSPAHLLPPAAALSCMPDVRMRKPRPEPKQSEEPRPEPCARQQECRRPQSHRLTSGHALQADAGRHH